MAEIIDDDIRQLQFQDSFVIHYGNQPNAFTFAKLSVTHWALGSAPATDDGLSVRLKIKRSPR